MAAMSSLEKHFYKENLQMTYSIKQQGQNKCDMVDGLNTTSKKVAMASLHSPSAIKTEWGTRVMFSPESTSLQAPLITIQPPSPSSQRSSTVTEVDTSLKKTTEPHADGAGKSAVIVEKKIVRSPSTDSHDNPFQPDGDIYKEADEILKHSIISRTEVKIVESPSLEDQLNEQSNSTDQLDDDTVKENIGNQVVTSGNQVNNGNGRQSPDKENVIISDEDVNVKENGKAAFEDNVNDTKKQIDPDNLADNSTKQDGETEKDKEGEGEEEKNGEKAKKEKKANKCCVIL